MLKGNDESWRVEVVTDSGRLVLKEHLSRSEMLKVLVEICDQTIISEIRLER
jgi:hypothetical protein